MPPHPDSRSRLLNAAEHLFGERGIHATSLRDITAKASVNLAAVNYHFGSKEGLVSAVLARRADPINQHRNEMLDRILAEAGDQSPSIEAVLHAFVDPAFILFDSNPPFLKFVARLFLEPEANFRHLMLRQFGDVARRFIAVLHTSLPEVPMPDLWVRFSFSVGAMLHTWTSHREAAAVFGLPEIDIAARALADQWVCYAAAGLRAAPKAFAANKTWETTL
ncbi:MAG: TetR family transcriptional regulator [Bryobacterales bacterium]|nr:TetR family transcriptional regulator [Bryobacterales bacterium]